MTDKGMLKRTLVGLRHRAARMPLSASKEYWVAA
jgi:hypothetical protein